jgi:hypothetical protein
MTEIGPSFMKQNPLPQHLNATTFMKREGKGGGGGYCIYYYACFFSYTCINP